MLSGAGRFWVGAAVSAAVLLLALRQVEPAQLGPHLAAADYRLVAGAALLQLVVMGAIAVRWGLLFRVLPSFGRRFQALLVAQLANLVIPVRLGMLVRAYLLGREGGQSKIAVFTTVLAEKVFDSLAFIVLFAAVLPVAAPQWFAWSALRLGTGLFAALFPAMLLATYQRRRLLGWMRALATWLPAAQRLGLVRRLEAGLEGLARVRDGRALALLWAWTLAIAGLGAVVNFAVLRAFGLEVPLLAAVFLLVVLQIGGKLAPAAPLGGIGIFQYLCMEALALFGVAREVGLSVGFVLHFVALVPGALLGALALSRMSLSLRQVRRGAEQSSGD